MGFFRSVWGKVTAFFAAALAFLTNFFGGLGFMDHSAFRNDYTIPETAAPYTRIDASPKTDWRARFIWDGSDGTEENVWMCLRKTVTLEKAPGTLKAYISADSRYWLYVNGENVVFEGGVKRGPTPDGSYFDEVELAPFLKPGKNVITALVWYWGKDSSFSSTDSGKAGFLFEAGEIVSDGSWKALRHPAYGNDPGTLQPNYRLPESNICFDAGKDIGDWTAPDFDDEKWENAAASGRGGDAPWGALYPRGIPLLKNSGLQDYLNSDDYKDLRLKRPRKLTLHLPHNAQCTPYLKVDSPAGKQIRIMTENTLLGAVSDVYTTKDGVQEFEALGWFNGEHITYEIPAGVTVLSLKYRETGYDTAFSGDFVCEDEALNVLWQKSLRTLYVTMRDNFMDCPDRERAQWWGDVTNEMAMSLYSLDPAGWLLYQKGVACMLGHVDPETKVLQTVVPNSNGFFELPAQQLAGVCGFWTYYLYTGDKDFLASVYDAAVDYVGLWEIGEDGLVTHREGSWDWLDWGTKIDVAALENAWVYYALSCLREMAAALGKDGGAFTRKMETLKAGYEAFWTPKGYKSPEAAVIDDRANAVAILSGLADEARYGTVAGVLTKTFHASPYMEYYVLEALCRMERYEEAKARILKRYGAMIRYDYSTLWEHWRRALGTLNHAWSGGPLVIMSKHFAGVKPLKPGYEEFLVRPQTTLLRKMECVVPTVKGYIRLSCEKKAGALTLDVRVPGKAKAVVCVPYRDGQTVKLGSEAIYENGQFLPLEGLSFEGLRDGCAVFSVTPDKDETLRFTAGK